MYIIMLGFAVAGVLGILLIVLVWLMHSHLKRSPKLTITITMAVLIFAINLAVIVKTYFDYKKFLEMETTAIQLIPNLAFAVFLDLTVLVIGGLFLYITNQLYISGYMKDEDKKENS